MTSQLNADLLRTAGERAVQRMFQAKQLSEFQLSMGSVEYDDRLHTTEVDGPSVTVSKAQTWDHLQGEIGKLKLQHQQILSWYFGLSGNAERTPAEIIKDTGHTSSSAINKIITKTLRALKKGMKNRGHDV